MALSVLCNSCCVITQQSQRHWTSWPRWSWSYLFPQLSGPTKFCICVCCWHTNMQTEAPVRLVLYEVSHYTGCFLYVWKIVLITICHPKLVHMQFEISLTNMNWGTALSLRRLNYLDAVWWSSAWSNQSNNIRAKIAASQTGLMLMALGIPGRSIAHHAHDSQGQNKGCKTPRNNMHIVACCIICSVQSVLSQSVWQVLQHIRCCNSKLKTIVSRLQ